MTNVMPVVGEEVSSEIDAILLLDVLKRNGEERLYDEIMKLCDGAEDDPPVMFDWENTWKSLFRLRRRKLLLQEACHYQMIRLVFLPQ